MRALVARTVAIAVGVAVAGCVRATQQFQANVTAERNGSYVSQFDYLAERFDRLYPSFGYKGVDWRAQRAIYRPRAMRARSQDELIAVVREMLQPLHDLHVFLIDPRGQSVPTYQPTRVANFDKSRWESALRDASYVGRGTSLGEATIGGYPYLFIGSWNTPVDVASLDLALAHLRVRDASGLIIDVRANAGGDDATAMQFVSRFVEQPFAASYVQLRNGPMHDDLDRPLARTVSPRGPWQYTRPVVVIAGRAAFSASESFVAAMRTLPNVTVIGDTTGGASGSPETFALAGGWRFTVPRWIEYGPDRKPIEGKGVPPTLPIAWNPASYDSARDPLIDAAVGILGERNGVYRMAPSGRTGHGGAVRQR